MVTDKAPTYPAIIKAMGCHADTDLPIEHINQKWRNNRIESDHASLKRIADPDKGFQTLRTAKSKPEATEPLLNALAEFGSLTIFLNSPIEITLFFSSLVNATIQSIQAFRNAQTSCCKYLLH